MLDLVLQNGPMRQQVCRFAEHKCFSAIPWVRAWASRCCWHEVTVWLLWFITNQMNCHWYCLLFLQCCVSKCKEESEVRVDSLDLTRPTTAENLRILLLLFWFCPSFVTNITKYFTWIVSGSLVTIKLLHPHYAHPNAGFSWKTSDNVFIDWIIIAICIFAT